MRRAFGLLLLAAFFVPPSAAYADAQAIDFRCIWKYAGGFIRTIVAEPDWDIETRDFTEEGGLGIPDVEEFALISLVLADPAAPNHETVHAGFAANAALARAALGSTIVHFTTSTYETGPMARQPIPGTDPQQYYGMDGVLAAFILLGEWDLYMENMQMFQASAFGAKVVVPTGSAGYTLLPELFRMCSDMDGDGASNAAEYWAASPYSFANAVNPAAMEAGQAWNVWACLDEPENNTRFWYSASTQRVYFKPTVPVTWAEALDYTIAYPGRARVPVRLCSIRDALENLFVDGLAQGDSIWIGCTDAGRDIGHTAPNPQDWYWLSDLTQSPMAYLHWATGDPNGVDGIADCAVMNASGLWQDVSEFAGMPLEPRRYAAVFELDGTYADEDGNGAPDAFEDKNGDGDPDGFVPPAPSADFAGAPVSGDMPLDVHFTDMSDGNGAPITAWAWDFGDGATSTEQNPAHTYMAEEPVSTYTVRLTVTTGYGTHTIIKTGYISVDYACPFGGQAGTQGAMFAEAVMAVDSIHAALKADLNAVGFSDWSDWDIEGIEDYPGSIPGDGLGDAIQMAFIEYVGCNAYLAASVGVFGDMTTNRVLFLADAAALAGAYPGFPDLVPYADFFAGMIGSSPEMKATINSICLSLTGGAAGLPNLDDYVVFGEDAKGAPLFAAYGDFDGDGLSNEAEWDLVVAAGFGLDEFLIAATDPNNFWPGNPELPAAGVLVLGLLTGSVLVAAGRVLRKRA